MDLLFGDENERSQAVANNAQSDLAQCAAFYATSARCLSDQKSQEVRVKMTQAAQKMLEYSVVVGQMAKMSEKAMSARMELFMKDMEVQIDSSCVNFSILLNQHLDTCKALLQNPEQAYASRFLKEFFPKSD